MRCRGTARASCSALAQTTAIRRGDGGDAAASADQRAALDRQAHIIEEQGRRLSALEERVEGVPATPTAAAAVGTQAALLQQPTSRTAAQPTPDLPTMVVSAGDFPGSIRIPGTESAFKLGGQAIGGGSR
jgi:hypothetical protein